MPGTVLSIWTDLHLSVQIPYQSDAAGCKREQGIYLVVYR